MNNARKDDLLTYYKSTTKSIPLKKLVIWALGRCKVREAIPLLLDDLRENAAGAYRRTLDFLDVPDDGRRSFPVENPAKERRMPGLHRLVRRIDHARRAIGIPFVGTGLMSKVDEMNRVSRPRAPLREAFRAELRTKQEGLRREHAKKSAAPLLSLAEARAKGPQFDWAAADLPVPAFTGVRTVEDEPLSGLVPFIDWSPFFHAWELQGVYPQILDDPSVGARARELLDDARRLLDEIVEKRLLRARGVWGLFPAGSVGDDIELFDDSARRRLLATFAMLRQQAPRTDGRPQLSLADFVAPRSTGRADHLGAFAVTAGHGAEELATRFAAAHDDYGAILAKALADRLAEAFAEKLHKEARAAWGYGAAESLSSEDLLRERYRGIRPAAGYPACPDHSEKRTLFSLLSATERAGIMLTESFAMHPAASVSGLYFAHPEARYFAIGRLGKDQVEDYARRKGISLSEAERWLAPNLGYEPASLSR